MIFAPVTQEYRLHGWPLESVYCVSLAAAAGGLGTSRGRRCAAIAVALIASLRLLGLRLKLGPVSGLATILSVALAILAAVSSLRFALQGKYANTERIGAALSAYLLAGQIFGVGYWQIGQLRAGSFAAAGVPAAAGALDLPTCVYFSFVTLATLGYGDIVPLTPTARSLAASEAIIGQLYLAVLIARLVGGRLAK
ncbi:MAG TPA: ion channel [Bryobacteraceae bacterium]|nr:ion channel [Bryobacteraceae bacterium]